MGYKSGKGFISILLGIFYNTNTQCWEIAQSGRCLLLHANLSLVPCLQVDIGLDGTPLIPVLGKQTESQISQPD